MFGSESDTRETQDSDDNNDSPKLDKKSRSDANTTVFTEESENNEQKAETSKNMKIEETKSDTSHDKEKKRKRNFESMRLEEKRKHYRCGKHFITLDSILTWPAYYKNNLPSQPDCISDAGVQDDELSGKVSLWQGDITVLEIDAIVNAANRSLLGGGGVDGCIHRAAGKELLVECRKLHGCETGKAKITSGYKLPAKMVIHTVGPIGENEDRLRSCYESCLELVKEHKLKSVAFCSISTGIYGYPIENAARVALSTVKEWLLENKEAVNRIIFCVFLQDDLSVYSNLMGEYFPCQPGDYRKEGDQEETQGNMEVDKQAESERSKQEKTGDVFPQDGDEDKLDKEGTIATSPIAGGRRTAKTHGDNGRDADTNNDKGNKKPGGMDAQKQKKKSSGKSFEKTKEGNRTPGISPQGQSSSQDHSNVIYESSV